MSGRRAPKALAIATIAAQGVFVAGTAVGGLIEGHGYDAGRHDISDLAALTAHHATLARLSLGIAGAFTIAFALLLLRPALRTADGRESVGAWLVAFSLAGWDNLSDAFFRLDCREADLGCVSTASFESWHGKVHIASYVIAGVATVIAPFLLSRRMRTIDGWRDLAGPTRIAGFVFLAALALTAFTGGTAVQGWVQRSALFLVSLCVVPLAVRVLRLTG
ncbi:DUF998 domain-containing protein [Kribbella sp. NBC_00709]|uniref:DUF998 domain-containing protein n=1 Tax=Kribbella sp. NBC_00709 TaxID=2975972 RepID=UPI002E297152|nr:DUF998 domain-containing protein [Kribbella sp. NBC_00709]